jgi:fumarate reductase subunit C
MLFAVEFHGASDCSASRSMGWFAGDDAVATRRRLRTFKWALTAFFLVLGLATLAAYIKIGIEHAPNYGEHYVPSWVATGAAP